MRSHRTPKFTIGEKMKKNILFACIVCLLIPSFVIAQSNFALNSESRTFESSTNEATYNFVQGWNFVPFSLSGQINEDRNIENRCGLEQILATFIWDPTEARYFGWADPSDMTSPTGQQITGGRPDYEAWKIYYDKYLQLVNYAQSGNSFVSNGGGFFYSKEPCNLKLKFDGTNPGKKLSKNANFISIDAWMIGKSPKDIFSNCMIEKINTWSNQEQKWTLIPEEMDAKAQEFQNDETPVRQDLLGIPFVIYVNDACEMK